MAHRLSASLRVLAIPAQRSIAPSQPRFLAHVTLVGVLLACTGLAVFPPTRFTFYPRCPIHEYLGILCPGCGATRALAALLHGHISAAMHQNALFVLLLPFAVLAGVRLYLRILRGREFQWPRISTRALTAWFLAATIFTIARNMPR